MRQHFFTLFLLFILPATYIYGQGVTIEGYTYESDNRGYIKDVKVTVFEKNTKVILGEIQSDRNGKFTFTVPVGQEFKIRGSHKLYDDTDVLVSSMNKVDGGKVFAKVVMYRKPGYIFDVTIAQKRDGDKPTDALTDTKVEIYNNTLKQEDLVIDNNPVPTFKHTFEQGNHYTIMIRKEGYLTKRMEAYVNVKGCILCFDGIGDVRPNVAETLTEGNQMGTLLANVELQPIRLNEGIKIDNIYYNYNESGIRDDAAKELEKLITLLRDNPTLDIELGSHTDARGKGDYNQKLSQERAQSAVDFIVSKGQIDSDRIVAKGYGESVLINDCKNGIECDEKLHEQNRRTELKITGIRNNVSNTDISLGQIIHEENMGRLLDEVVNSEEIRIPEGGELPPEMRAASNNTSTSPTSYQAPAPAPTPSYDQKGGVTSTPEPVTPQPMTTEKPAASMSDLEGAVVETATETVKAVETKVAEVTEVVAEATTPQTYTRPQGNIITDPNDIGKKRGSTQSDLYQPGESVKATKGEVDNYGMVVRIVDANGNTVGNGQKGKELHAYQVFQHNRATIDHYKDSVTKYKRRVVPTLMKMEYTGYKIEIEQSGGELPISHEIFGSHGNITYDITKDGSYSYMLGDFKELKDANSFHMDIIRPRYPHSRVIQYKEGIRLNK